MQESEYNFAKLVLSFQNASPGGQTHVVRLGSKHFYSLTQKGNFKIWFLHLLNEEANDAFLTRLREDDIKSQPNQLLAYPCNLCFICRTIATKFLNLQFNRENYVKEVVHLNGYPYLLN